MINIGILGVGAIAEIMAETLNGMKRNGDGRFSFYGAASRDLKKARNFAEKYGVERAYGSYEEMAEDENVDLVYIATPHSHHKDHALLCLNHGKHVLCEKAFTRNAREAKEVVEAAEKRGLLLAEAIWTRYMPMRDMINETLSSGIIGKPCMLTANLGYPMTHKERLVKPELAGGALLDVGIYTLNFAVMAFGDAIEGIDSSAQLTSLGVDAQETITLRYRDGRMASLNSTMNGMSDRQGIIYGDKGYMVVENINNPQSITVYDENRDEVKKILCPPQITGYEYEVQDCLEAIEKGLTECPRMPHSETIKMMEIMDGLRKDWGVKYPGE